ncbi:MAG: glycosyltransferase [Methanobacteriota archaeon]
MPHATTDETGPRVSLVMPVKNEARRIESALLALRDQTLRPIEVLVVDGHSLDGTVDLAKTLGARVLFEDYGTRAGACQVGVRNASGDLVAFTDADCIPAPDWLETLASNLDAGVVGVGGRIVSEGDTFWQVAVDAALDTTIGSANSVQGRMFREKRFVSSISGSNSLYRRTDLLAVGGFRTDLVTTEDTELNRRLLARGKLLYVPDAVIRHRHERGLREFARRIFQYGFGRGQSLLPGPPLLMPLAFLSIVVLGFVLPWFALALAAAYAGVVLVSAASVAVRRRRAGFLLSVPVIYLIEHASYVAGFWVGLFRSRWSKPRKPSVLEGPSP